MSFKNEIKTETNYSLKALKEATLEEYLEHVHEYTDKEQAQHEIADSNVPIYNWDLSQYLAHNFKLAFAHDYEIPFNPNEENEILVFRVINHLNQLI